MESGEPRIRKRCGSGELYNQLAAAIFTDTMRYLYHDTELLGEPYTSPRKFRFDGLEDQFVI